MKDFFELEVCIEQWAQDKGILEYATTTNLSEKTLEKVLGLMSAIDEDNREEIKYGIGDIMVTLIIQAKMQGMTIEECLNAAYDVISKRTGKMINGQFVKD